MRDQKQPVASIDVEEATLLKLNTTNKTLNLFGKMKQIV